YWGPEPGRVAYEQFDEAPGRVRQVQYFDKSRMEPNALVLQRTPQPTPPPDSPWAVTNGLLVVELISGQEQLGISHFVPIGDANWARAKIAGQQKDVLIQAFERRVLTYNPTNPAGFQVEVGNVGQHYLTWRYPHGLPGPVPTRSP